MSFTEKLNVLMDKKDISQTRLAELTGIAKSSINQYVSGKNKPARARRKQIAKALGVEEDYFEVFDINEMYDDGKCVNVPVALAAKLMGKSREFITQGLQDGIFPWGYAVKLKSWSYFISSVKFTEHTGITVPLHSSFLKINIEGENEENGV